MKVRIKGLVIGVMLAYVFYLLQMSLIASDLLNQMLGDNVLSSFVTAGVSLIFVAGMIGLIQGLRQFITGNDFFSFASPSAGKGVDDRYAQPSEDTATQGQAWMITKRDKGEYRIAETIDLNHEAREEILINKLRDTLGREPSQEEIEKAKWNGIDV